MNVFNQNIFFEKKWYILSLWVFRGKITEFRKRLLSGLSKSSFFVFRGTIWGKKHFLGTFILFSPSDFEREEYLQLERKEAKNCSPRLLKVHFTCSKKHSPENKFFENRVKFFIKFRQWNKHSFGALARNRKSCQHRTIRLEWNAIVEILFFFEKIFSLYFVFGVWQKISKIWWTFYGKLPKPHS